MVLVCIFSSNLNRDCGSPKVYVLNQSAIANIQCPIHAPVYSVGYVMMWYFALLPWNIQPHKNICDLCTHIWGIEWMLLVEEERSISFAFSAVVVGLKWWRSGCWVDFPTRLYRDTVSVLSRLRIQLARNSGRERTYILMVVVSVG